MNGEDAALKIADIAEKFADGKLSADDAVMQVADVAEKLDSSVSNDDKEAVNGSIDDIATMIASKEIPKVKEPEPVKPEEPKPKKEKPVVEVAEKIEEIVSEYDPEKTTFKEINMRSKRRKIDRSELFEKVAAKARSASSTDQKIENAIRAKEVMLGAMAEKMKQFEALRSNPPEESVPEEKVPGNDVSGAIPVESGEVVNA